jgi:hypothetical protein
LPIAAEQFARNAAATAAAAQKIPNANQRRLSATVCRSFVESLFLSARTQIKRWLRLFEQNFRVVKWTPARG